MLFTSALLGALLSAGLALVVRWIMDTRAQRVSERQLAYVHLITVSQLIAMETVIAKYVEALGVEKLLSGLKPANGEFEPSHKACVLLAEKLTGKAATTRPDASALASVAKLRMLLDSLKSTKLDADKLAKLPRPLIERLAALDGYVALSSVYLDQWIRYVEKDDTDWISAEVLYEQWLHSRKLLGLSKDVRALMVANRVTSQSEADELLKRQVATAAREGFALVLERPKLEAARTSMERANGL